MWIRLDETTAIDLEDITTCKFSGTKQLAFFAPERDQYVSFENERHRQVAWEMLVAIDLIDRDEAVHTPNIVRNLRQGEITLVEATRQWAMDENDGSLISRQPFTLGENRPPSDNHSSPFTLGYDDEED